MPPWIYTGKHRAKDNSISALLIQTIFPLFPSLKPNTSKQEQKLSVSLAQFPYPQKIFSCRDEFKFLKFLIV